MGPPLARVVSGRAGAVAPQLRAEFVGAFVADGVCPTADLLQLAGGQAAGVPDQLGGLGCVWVGWRAVAGQVDAGQRAQIAG